jgi:hypothetical protein
MPISEEGNSSEVISGKFKENDKRKTDKISDGSQNPTKIEKIEMSKEGSNSVYREEVIEKKNEETEDNNSVEDVMEKTRTDILIEKSKVNYNAVVKIISDLYDNVLATQPSSNYTRKTLLANYDSYLQAILIKLCAINDNFSKDSMTFVENIADYGKLVEGTDFNLFADCAKEMREVITSKADERLKEVPTCFKLAGAVDSGRQLGVTRTMLDCTVKIAFNLKFVDCNADVKNNEDVISALKSIYVFTTANGIDLK